MNYQKLMKKEKALELMEFFKKVEKFNQLKRLNNHYNLVGEIKKENESLENEIYNIKKQGLFNNDFYSETNNYLKMEFIANVHRQQYEKTKQLNEENENLKACIKDTNNLINQYEVVGKKLKECHKNLKKEIDKKFHNDCM